MNARSVILGLSFLVVALVAGLFYLLLREPTLSPVFAPVPVPQTNVVTRVAVRKFNSTNYFLLPSGFSWSSIESTNYPNYILNLRAIGCPEETIRDIVVADVAKLFAKRRAELFGTTEATPFWKTEEDSDRRIQQAARALEDEQRSLIRTLLGVDLGSEVDKFNFDAPGRPLDFSFLEESKRDRVKAILEKFNRRERDLRDQAGGLWIEADDAALREQTKLQEIELKAILSPKELEEYSLRFSPLSNELRSSLRGFDPTEEEFRKFFQLRKTYDEAMAGIASAANEGNANGERLVQLQSEAQELLNNELKDVLGSTRWEKYERQQEPSYQTLSRLSERFGLPTSVADRAYDFLKTAEEQSQKLMSDPNLDPDRLEQALRELGQETSLAVSNALGAGVFRAFQGAGGNAWLRPNVP